MSNCQMPNCHVAKLPNRQPHKIVTLSNAEILKSPSCLKSKTSRLQKKSRSIRPKIVQWRRPCQKSIRCAAKRKVIIQKYIAKSIGRKIIENYQKNIAVTSQVTVPPNPRCPKNCRCTKQVRNQIALAVGGGSFAQNSAGALPRL